MILIESCNKIISDALLNKHENPSEKFNTTLADFDGVLFQLTSDASSSVVSVQMSMKCYKQDLLPLGVEDILKATYSTQQEDSAVALIPGDAQFDVGLSVDLGKVALEHRDALIKKVASLKTICISAPFHAAFNAQLSGSGGAGDLMVIQYRQDEDMFVKAGKDRVTVVFSLRFKEESDVVIGRIFLQEFVDCRKQASLQNGPQVLYATNKSEVPMEVRGFYKDGVPENMSFVTFVLFPRHYEKPEMKEMTIGMIHYFRSYLHYHIKCSKAYMHSRMRSKVDSWMKVLNRARVESDEKKEKKLASGKTFVRK